MIYQRFTRTEFYELIWSKPLSELAPAFEMSDVALGKLCAKLDIPRPGVGHWAKLAAGKSVKKAPLPTRSFGESELVEFGNDPGVRLEATEQFLAQPLPEAPTFDTPMEVIRERAVAKAAQVPVVKSLKNAHPSIAKLLEKDEELNKKAAEHRFGDLLYKTRFGTGYEKRRLKVLNSVALALIHCGCLHTIQGTDARTPYVRVGSVSITYSLGTRAEVDDAHRRGRGDKQPDTELVLSIHPWVGINNIQLEWKDAEGAPLEDQIKDIVAGFLVAGEAFYRQWRIHRHTCEIDRIQKFKTQVQQTRDEAVKRELMLAARKKQEARRQLIVEMQSWRRAQHLREYVEAKRKAALETGDALVVKQVDNWANWALQEADAIDPLATSKWETHSATEG